MKLSVKVFLLKKCPKLCLIFSFLSQFLDIKDKVKMIHLHFTKAIHHCFRGSRILAISSSVSFWSEGLILRCKTRNLGYLPCNS